jgi:type I restriction enzyme S subunit
MPNDWARKTVAELQANGLLLVEDGNHGEYRPRTSEFGNGEWAFIRAADMDNGTVLFDSAERINDVAFERIRKGIGKGGDVLFSHKGTVGKLAIVPLDAPQFVCSPQTTFWRTLDEARLSRRFLYYYMQSRAFTEQWMGRKGETDMADYVSLTAQRQLYVSFPPIGLQQKIAAVLGSLDDKIEQNRWTGVKLEGLARAVFKAWFVDFEPVKAKAAGATAFPGMPPETFATLPSHFQETTLGTVPQGWEVKYAGELASFILGGDWGKDIATEETPDPAHCIRGADIPDLWANGLGKMPIRYLKSGSLQKRSLRPGDIAIEISGGSPTQSTGRPVLVTESLLSELQHPLVCSNFCRIFRPKQHYTNFTYFLLRWLYDAEQFLQYENGTTGIKNFAFTKFCEVHPVVTPHESLLTSFDTWIEPLMQAMAHAGRESRKLAALRDYLLPRLLSGRVRIEKATT